MLHQPFYDPEKTYEENFQSGPFGAFSDGVVIENKGEPQYEFLGQKVFSPFGIAAGPLINGKFAQAALDKGFDIVVYKTVRTEKYPCHPWPNILAVKIPENMVLGKKDTKLVADKDFKEPLSITNSFGVPSWEPDFWQEDIKKIQKNLRPGQVLVGAFQRTKKEGKGAEEYIRDFVRAAGLMKETGVNAMEVNFSCPNEGTSELLCYDVKRSGEVIRAIKEEIKDIPLVVKISYYNDSQNLEDFIKEVGPLVQGISAINTIFSEIVGKDGKPALPGRTHSGVCGHGIKSAGLEMIGRLKKLREEFGLKYSIIGVGGVMSAEDFLEYRQAGADAVMSATGAMWNPYLAKEIKSRLEAEDPRLKSGEKLR